MSKIFSVFILSLMIITATPLMGSANWEVVGSPSFTDASKDQSLAFDSANTPYIAYMEWGTDYKARVKRFNGSSWELVGTGGISDGRADQVSLVIDSTDIPYILYCDDCRVSRYSFTVMKYTGNTSTDSDGTPNDGWEYVGQRQFFIGIDGELGDPHVTYHGLAFDNGNIPYVVFHDNTASYKATVMKFDGSSWVILGYPGITQGGAIYPSITFDSANTPYVVYIDQSNSSKVSVIKFDGASWLNVGTAGFTPAGFSYGNFYSPPVDITLDSANTPYVVYQDSLNSNKASVMMYDGSNWIQVGSAGFSEGEAEYLNIVVDSSDILYVAYKDMFNSGKTTVMKFDGSGWALVGSPGFSPDGVSFYGYVSLALDDFDAPYVAYADDINQGTSVMKFAASINTISGFVTTPDHLPIYGAKVILRQRQTVLDTIRTDVNGYYEFTALSDGRYVIVGKRHGYVKDRRIGRVNKSKQYARDEFINLVLTSIN